MTDSPNIDDYFDSVVDPFHKRPMYFDKQGNPISMREMGELKWGDGQLAGDGTYAEDSYMRIGYDELPGDVSVSTVWLGIDHGFPMRGTDLSTYKPVIFETMIFGGEHDQFQMRYCTEAEARQGHREVVADLRAGMDPGWAFGGVDEDAWVMKHD